MGFEPNQISPSAELELFLFKKSKTKQIARLTGPFRCAMPFIQATEEAGTTLIWEPDGPLKRTDVKNEAHALMGEQKGVVR